MLNADRNGSESETSGCCFLSLLAAGGSPRSDPAIVSAHQVPIDSVALTMRGTIMFNKQTVTHRPLPNCRYWSACGTAGGGCCALSRFGGRPSLGTCGGCISRGENHPVGAGDTVAAVLNATGVGPAAMKVIGAATGKPCRCAKRQAALNRLLPYAK
jgi:hypothetical protein